MVFFIIDPVNLMLTEANHSLCKHSKWFVMRNELCVTPEAEVEFASPNQAEILLQSNYHILTLCKQPLLRGGILLYATTKDKVHSLAASNVEDKPYKYLRIFCTSIAISHLLRHCTAH